MMWALFILASGAMAEPAPSVEPRGAQVASATVTVRILRPVIIRRSGGWRQGSADEPVPQISRRAGQVLIEFQ